MSGPADDAGARAIGEVTPPRQERSRRSYHRILEATAELLADRPFDDITVEDIVTRAGYTKGAFYARFDSKGTLLRHLVARLTDGALDAWDEFLRPDRWDGRPLVEIVEAFVQRMVNIYTRSGHVMRALDREVQLGGDEAVTATVARLNARVAEGFIRLIEHRRDELPETVQVDVEGTCRYWLMALAAVLRGGYLRPADGLEPVSRDDVARRTRRLMVPYLTR